MYILKIVKPYILPVLNIERIKDENKTSLHLEETRQRMKCFPVHASIAKKMQYWLSYIFIEKFQIACAV